MVVSVEGDVIMSACAQFEDALWDAAESGRIPDALQRHCVTCRHCREALQDMQQIVTGLAALQALPVPAPRPDLTRHLPRQRRRWSWALSLATAAACCLAILCFTFRHSRRQYTQEPTRHVQTPLPVPPRPLTPTAAPRVTPTDPVQTPVPQIAIAPVQRPHAVRRVRHPRPQPVHSAAMPEERVVTAPTLIAIMGTDETTQLPAEATALEADRIMALYDAPEIANQVYQTIETIGPGDISDCQIIYENPAGG